MKYVAIFTLINALNSPVFAGRARVTEVDAQGAILPRQPVMHLVWEADLVAGASTTLVETRQYVCLLHPCDPYEVTIPAVVIQATPTLELEAGGVRRYFHWHQLSE